MQSDIKDDANCSDILKWWIRRKRVICQHADDGIQWDAELKWWNDVMNVEPHFLMGPLKAEVEMGSICRVSAWLLEVMTCFGHGIWKVMAWSVHGSDDLVCAWDFRAAWRTNSRFGVLGIGRVHSLLWIWAYALAHTCILFFRNKPRLSPCMNPCFIWN